jgi:hypothetical protein
MQLEQINKMRQATSIFIAAKQGGRPTCPHDWIASTKLKLRADCVS